MDCELTTLGAHGRKTAVGPHQAVEFAPIDLAWRAEVGRLVETDLSLEQRLGRRMGLYLALAVTRLGGEDLTAITLEDRLQRIARLRLADMMYLGMLRLAEQHGGVVQVPAGDPCPTCGHSLPPVIDLDLRRLQVRVAPEVPRTVYTLQDPWSVNGARAETITVEAPTIASSVLPMQDKDFQVGILRELAWVAAGVVEVNGAPMRLTAQQLSARDADGHGISDRDWAGLAAAFEGVFCGPSDHVDYQHTCGAVIPMEVGWVSGFFGRSVA